MNFGELLEITKNKIDETFEDEQIDIIIKDAINSAYLSDLSRIDPTFKTSVAVIVNGVARLPSNMHFIEKLDRELEAGEYIKGKSLFSPKEEEQIGITYAVIPEKLIEDEDEPTISESLQNLLITNACYEYFKHRKKNSVARLYQESYMLQKAEFEESNNSSGLTESVQDVYGGDL